jgi:hypothetical protein
MALFAPMAHAKRGPKPVVQPIQINGIEFRVPNNPETEGIVQAWDPISNKLLWSVRAYRNPKIPLLEKDVQWNFVKLMSLASNNRDLVIVDERGKTYFVSVDQPRVESRFWKTTAPLTFGLIVTTLIFRKRRGGSVKPSPKNEANGSKIKIN